MNAIFRDAHVGLQYPTREFDAYWEAGGVVFPIAVADKPVRQASRLVARVVEQDFGLGTIAGEPAGGWANH